jgi:lysozyme family protein
VVAIPQLIALNAARWVRCVILPARQAEVNKVAARLIASQAKAVYQALALATGVPWWVIAVIHEREADQDFSRSIAQGDPWNAPSRHVPKLRGPFKSFKDAAIDALTKCPPRAAEWKDWSAGGTLTLLEEYNGLGYEDYHSEPSPYLFGGTNIEQQGKYVADGRWSAEAWDMQLGCAAMLRQMLALDPSIHFGAPT